MEKSEQLNELAKALVLFHVKVDKIKKDSTNPFFKSKYASLSGILESIDSALNESNLTIIQTPTGTHELTTMLLHSSGQYIMDTYFMKPTKDDPQGLGSSITYQRRYALGAILSLNIDEDDDANEASVNNNPQDDGKPWLNKGTDQFDKALKFIQDGGKVSDIEKKYKISKEVKELLLK